MMNVSNISTLYVSQKNGSWMYTGFKKEEDGNFQGPLDSIEDALKLIKDMRRAGAYQPVTVVITDDIYTIKTPVKIDNTVNAVTFKGLENTIISGGKMISGFKDASFNGKKCFSAEVPEIKDGFWFTDLYVDGIRADFTYLPKEGFFEPESVENNKPALGETSKWFIAKKEDVSLFKTFRNFNDCFISYNHYWIDEHSPVESIDANTGKIVMKYSSRFSISDRNERSKLRYRLENVAEAFENKNEWYLDRETKKVYYMPRDDNQTPDNIEVYAPISEKLFVIEGEKENKTEYIAFENLTFAYTCGDYISRSGIATNDEEGCYASDDQAVCNAPGVIEFTHAHGCLIRNCTLRNLGLHAVNIKKGCDGMEIYGNRFFDIGAGAIVIGGGQFGCEKTDETYGNTISQNIINCIGRRYYAACGILMKHTYSNRVSHNDISDTYYTGISVGWVWGYSDNISRDNIIEKNHIYKIGQGRLSDMGGVYVLGTQPGTVIRNNIIHDVTSKHYGGHGIYTDEGTCYIVVENNICYNNNSTGFNQHYGRMNIVRNNIFAKAGQEPVRSSKEELHTSFILERNIIVSDGFASYQAGYGGRPTGYMQKIGGTYNLHFNTKETAYMFSLNGKKITLCEVQELYGMEEGSIIADPMFADYVNNDFTLMKNSPAFELGFEPIDTTDVGVTINI